MRRFVRNSVSVRTVVHRTEGAKSSFGKPPESVTTPERLTHGSRVDLRWDPPVAASVVVVGCEVCRDGSWVGKVTEPRASDEPPGPGSYTYTVTAVVTTDNTLPRPGRRPLLW